MSKKLPNLSDCTIAVVGLGYVGLPLAVEFSRTSLSCSDGLPLSRRVIGFDINQKRLKELSGKYDCTNETSEHELSTALSLEFTSDINVLAEADVYIITVPTPITLAKRPDFTPLEKATATVGKALQIRTKSCLDTTPVVIYESTVYPGATEEICVPILEKFSGLIFNKDFYCGYSPERINPGDTKHRLRTIVKVTSGSTDNSSQWVNSLYASIIEAGTHEATSIKVAEAAKVIENTQRDLNIALVNELAVIFRRLKIDTLDVLEAAGTKWNFLPFKPGLVGGHCIGVDPYYLTHKAEQVGYHPQVVLAGRRINDGMGHWVVEQVVLELAKRHISVGGTQVLVMGLTFKENCPDFRNTRVTDIITSLSDYGMVPTIVDPCVDASSVKNDLDIDVIQAVPTSQKFKAIIVAVAHTEFSNYSPDVWSDLLAPQGIIYDLKGIVPRQLLPIRL